VQSWTRSAPHEASEATPPAGSPIEPFRAPGIRLSSPNAAVLARRRAARATNRSRSAGKRRPGRFGVEIGSVGRILEQEGFREERETSGLADEAEAATGQRRATTPLYLLLTYCSLLPQREGGVQHVASRRMDLRARWRWERVLARSGRRKSAASRNAVCKTPWPGEGDPVEGTPFTASSVSPAPRRAAPGPSRPIESDSPSAQADS
jgi:hypothetical protein